jgi:hypothetical protein
MSMGSMSTNRLVAELIRKVIELDKSNFHQKLS